MAATDQHYRNQRTLNIVFALSSVAMFASVIWMMVDDYRKQWKRDQREFRNVEVGINLSLMLDNLPTEEELKESREAVADKRQAVEDKKAELTKIRKERLAERDVADAEYNAVKAYYDSRSSYRDQDVERYGENSPQVRARDKELADLKEKMDRARKRLDEAEKKLAEDIGEELRKYEDELAKAEDYQKELAGAFDRFAKVAAAKRWKGGDTFRNLPILDAFTAPTRIKQIVLDELPIDYSFKYATRFDRCDTCHLGIDHANYDH